MEELGPEFKDPTSRYLCITTNSLLQPKIRQISIQRLLGDILYTIVSLSDLDITHDIEETSTTFEENAILKKTYCSMTGLPSLADDSGLEVVAHNGEPRIFPNGYPGEHTTEEQKQYG